MLVVECEWEGVCLYLQVHDVCSWSRGSVHVGS